MNPDTNELVRFSSIEGTAGLKKEMAKFKEKGFIPVPQTLERAASLKLGKKKSVFVSKTSGGKLSKWAAKKRRQRTEQKKTVDRCNNYYDVLEASNHERT